MSCGQVHIQPVLAGDLLKHNFNIIQKMIKSIHMFGKT